MNRYSKTKFIENGYLKASKKPENNFVDTHFHDFFELEYIISGSGTYTVDGKEKWEKSSRITNILQGREEK